MLVGICGQKKAAEELTQLMQEGARGVVRCKRRQLQGMGCHSGA